MAYPKPEQGLVIRYSFLWRSEAAQGREEGRKDRPCAVVLAVTREDERTQVLVAPVTHTPPPAGSPAIEIPAQTKQRLGLDHERSWIVADELNLFTWPGPDVRLIDKQDAERGIAYGYLPDKTTRQLVQAVREQIKSGRTKAVRRDEG